MTIIPEIAMWGRDHWSTFAYIETRIVDHNGQLSAPHLRGHIERRPLKYPTDLIHGETVANHDDYDCIGDMIAYSLLEMVGSTVSDITTSCDLIDMDLGDYVEISVENGRLFRFTPVGADLASTLRAHKAAGNGFGSFRAPNSAAFRSRLASYSSIKHLIR